MRTHFLGPLRSIRGYSQVAGEQAKRWEYFSLFNKGGKGSQVLVLDKLRAYVKYKQEKQEWAADLGATSSSLVLLASRDLAPWLEDREFMSDFLGSLQASKNAKGKATIDVLSGVTEGLGQPRHFRRRQPASGLSVIYGTQNILPRLWEQDDAESSRDVDRSASISISTARPGNPFSSNLTIPLANTIFQNGRRSTLFATRYETDPSGRAEATLMREKTHQDIHITTEKGPVFKSHMPLMPLAPPRKIVAGLGNIVRQVEVNGVATPASTEIEKLIPQLLERRNAQGAVGVWAVVIPPHLMKNELFANIVPFSRIMNNPKEMSDWKLFELNREMFWKFNHYGFRIHKILSGGGGWGAKQGLLSLDPDISYTRPDQDNIDDFIKAFEARDSTDASQGIVAPGSYILFCVEPEVPKSVNNSLYLNHGLYFGVSEKKEYEVPKKVVEKEEESGLTVLPHYFSAMTSEGLYLKLDTPGHEAEMQSYPFNVKLDVPHSHLRHPGR